MKRGPVRSVHLGHISLYCGYVSLFVQPKQTEFSTSMSTHSGVVVSFVFVTVTVLPQDSKVLGR